jgi:Flp pilus assembly protein TadG
MRKHILNRPGRRRRRAGSLIEMALTMAILFNLCYGTIEFGYYFFVKNTLQGAAREGCRAGIVAGATDSSVTSAVIGELSTSGLVATNTTSSGSGPYTCGNYTVTVSPATGSTSIGSALTVTVSGQWGTVGAGFRPLALIGSNKQVTGSAVMRKEG